MKLMEMYAKQEAITQEEIDQIRDEYNQLRSTVFSRQDDSETDGRLSKKSQHYLCWLIEKCDDIVSSIAKGENLPKVAVHIGILRQEMSNIIPPLCN